jgi:hypothetical protein
MKHSIVLDELSAIGDTLESESRDDLKKYGLDIKRLVQILASDDHTIASDAPVQIESHSEPEPTVAELETEPIKTIPIQSRTKLPMVKESTVLLTDIVDEIDEFILTKCVFHPKFSTITSDLRDAYNKSYNRNISLIAFSKKFKEVSGKYQIERIQGKKGLRSGVWFNGIGLKP